MFEAMLASQSQRNTDVRSGLQGPEVVSWVTRVMGSLVKKQSMSVKNGHSGARGGGESPIKNDSSLMIVPTLRVVMPLWALRARYNLGSPDAERPSVVLPRRAWERSDDHLRVQNAKHEHPNAPQKPA
ncbi:hypothetical protein Pstr01_34150 [Pseudomonas straminea]|nr:hypothetical protein Pstr01_34150 [Pseudomonas straminea]